MTLEYGLPPVNEQPLVYVGPLLPTKPGNIFLRAPTVKDTDYPIGFEWVFQNSPSSTQLWERVPDSTVWQLLEGTGGGVLPVPSGGTGQGSFPIHSVLLGEGVAPIGNTGAGIAGQILISGGPSADPFWTPGFTFGAVQTIGAVSSDLITFDCGAVPGTYTFSVEVAGFDPTPLAAGYTIVGTVRTTGVAATFIDQQVDAFEEGALVGALATLTVSGNNAIIGVTGVGGHTINWTARLIYVFAHA